MVSTALKLKLIEFVIMAHRKDSRLFMQTNEKMIVSKLYYSVMTELGENLRCSFCFT
jgi:hypothetical protein